MRRSDSEIIRNLEMKIARLEKQSSPKVHGRLVLVTEDYEADRFPTQTIPVSGVREIKKAIKEYDLTEASHESYSDSISLTPSDRGESQGYESIELVLSKENIAMQFMDRLGIEVRNY